jgi:hypothetical protein
MHIPRSQACYVCPRGYGVRCGGYAQRKITPGNEVSRNSYLGQHISARGRRICFFWIPRPAIDDVPVQRHSAYVELSGHGPHGQSVRPSRSMTVRAAMPNDSGVERPRARHVLLRVQVYRRCATVGVHRLLTMGCGAGRRRDCLAQVRTWFHEVIRQVPAMVVPGEGCLTVLRDCRTWLRPSPSRLGSCQGAQRCLTFEDGAAAASSRFRSW